MKIVNYVYPSLFGDTVIVTETKAYEGELAILLGESDIGKPLFDITYEEGKTTTVSRSEEDTPYLVRDEKGWSAVLPFRNINEAESYIAFLNRKFEEFDREAESE